MSTLAVTIAVLVSFFAGAHLAWCIQSRKVAVCVLASALGSSIAMPALFGWSSVALVWGLAAGFTLICLVRIYEQGAPLWTTVPLLYSVIFTCLTVLRIFTGTNRS
jgi:hypothetical protein